MPPHQAATRWLVLASWPGKGVLAILPTTTVLTTPIVGYQKKDICPSHVRVAPQTASFAVARVTGLQNAVAVKMSAMNEHEHNRPTVAPHAYDMMQCTHKTLSTSSNAFAVATAVLI